MYKLVHLEHNEQKSTSLWDFTFKLIKVPNSILLGNEVHALLKCNPKILQILWYAQRQGLGVTLSHRQFNLPTFFNAIPCLIQGIFNCVQNIQKQPHDSTSSNLVCMHTCRLLLELYNGLTMLRWCSLDYWDRCAIRNPLFNYSTADARLQCCTFSFWSQEIRTE